MSSIPESLKMGCSIKSRTRSADIIYIWNTRREAYKRTERRGKSPLCVAYPGTVHVKRAARTLPHKYARTRTRVHTYLRAYIRPRTCPRVDATDNMQLRALSCSAVRARSVLSPVERPRHAWRKRRGHAEYADNEMLQTLSPRGVFRITSINGRESAESRPSLTRSLRRIRLCRSINWSINLLATRINIARKEREVFRFLRSEKILNSNLQKRLL